MDVHMYATSSSFINKIYRKQSCYSTKVSSNTSCPNNISAMETQDALSSFSHIVNTGHYTMIQKQIFIARIFVLRIVYFKTHTFFFSFWSTSAV